MKLFSRIKRAYECFRYNGETYQEAFRRVIERNREVCRANAEHQRHLGILHAEMRKASQKLSDALCEECPSLDDLTVAIMDVREDLEIAIYVSEEVSP